MKPNLNRLIGLINLIFISFVFPVLAQEYPNKPVTLVVPYPAGGSTDVTGRALANAARKYFGQPIIIENKSGGGGSVGPSLVIAKPADGYTLGIYSGALPIAWHMGKLNFNPIEDVTHIVRYSGYIYGLVVRADAPWATIEDLIKYAKANPGKVSYGTPGVGTNPHLVMEDLALLTGVQWVHMPFKGGAETNTALLGGHVDAVSDSTGWAPMVDAGKFRLLVTYGTQRIARYPQVPTLKEAGFDMAYPSPLEIIGPKGLPMEIVKKVHDAFKKGMEDPEYQGVLKKFDMPMTYLGGDELEKADREDFDRMGKIVQKLGLNKK